MASEHFDLTSLRGALVDLLGWFEDSKVEGVVVGGVAAAVLGRPRLTRDVDAVVFLEQDRWPAFLEEGGRHRFVPRISDALTFARQSRVLLLRHEASEIDVDISLAALPFEREMLVRRRIIEVDGVPVPLPTPEDLIIMKAVANRPRDWQDIEGIVKAQSGLDQQRIRSKVQEFADVLEMPELVEHLNAALP